MTRNRLARLKPDGSLDIDFHPDVNGLMQCIAVQFDGKMMIGGTFTMVEGVARNRIAGLVGGPSAFRK